MKGAIEFQSELACRLQTARTVTWIGAVSFEPRCVTSLHILAERQVPVSSVVLLDYATRSEPNNLGKMARDKHRSELRDLAGALGARLRSYEVSAYSGLDLRRTVLESVWDALRNEENEIIVDITCLTKIHAIMLTAGLGSFYGASITLAYSVPEAYSGLAGKRKGFPGFSTTLVVPLSDKTLLGDERNARGIIILGHESQRLVVALAEYEPAGGVIVQSVTPDRPDFEDVTRQRNKRVVTELLRRPGWQRKRVRFSAFEAMREIVTEQAREARQSGAPMLLFPFGPKSIVVAAAMACSVDYPEGTWIVYPIPSVYDTFYTRGVAGSYWLSL